ncbi:MAG: preprotein translocase subunit SecE [Bacteroidales bacterium]|jgi:preprotein translocase subunit SecE
MGIKTYITESYKELVQKVTWPSWAELQSSALVVMVATLIIALVVLVMDLAFKNLMEVVYKMIV